MIIVINCDFGDNCNAIMLINLSDDDIELAENSKDNNELMQEIDKKDSRRYTTKVYYNRGLSERSDNSSSDEERK